MHVDFEKWRAYVATLDYNPLFVTVSGAHLYGFPSPDSDIDLRGCHQLPLRDIVGLRPTTETFERDEFYDEIEVDIVSHDIGKYFALLIKNNGYVLEQIFSPLVIVGSHFLSELRTIAKRCVTRHHYHHYRGFYATQRRLLEKETEKRAKPVLYAYRVLLTGIHLLRSGEVESNLLNLNEEFKLPYIDELIASKTEEKIAPKNLDWNFHASKLDRLEETLEQAFDSTGVTGERDVDAVDEFLLNLRLDRPQRRQQDPRR